MPDPLRVLLVAPPDAAAAAVNRLRARGPVTPALAPSVDLLRAALGSMPWDALLLIPGSSVRVAEVVAALAETPEPPAVVVEADRRPAALPDALLILPGETAALADLLATLALAAQPEPSAQTAPEVPTFKPASGSPPSTTPDVSETSPDIPASNPDLDAADLDALDLDTTDPFGAVTSGDGAIDAGSFDIGETDRPVPSLSVPDSPSTSPPEAPEFAPFLDAPEPAPGLGTVPVPDPSTFELNRPDSDEAVAPSLETASGPSAEASVAPETFFETEDPIELGATVTAAVAAVQPLAQAKGVGLDAHIAPDLWVSADAQALADGVTDLLRHAVKYTDDGTIRVEVAATDSEAWFRVTDQGFGVAESARECLDLHFSTSLLLDSPPPADTGSEANRPLAVAGGTISARALMPGTEVSIRFERRSAPDTLRAFFHPAPMTHPTPPQSPGDGHPEAATPPTHQGDGHAAFVARPQPGPSPAHPGFAPPAQQYAPPPMQGQAPPQSFEAPAPQPGFAPPSAPQGYAPPAPQPSFAPPAPAETMPQQNVAPPAPQGFAPAAPQQPAFAPQQPQSFAPPAPQPQAPQQAPTQGFEPAAPPPSFSPSAPAADAGTPATPATEAAAPSGKRRILVVEDNNDTRMLLERILRRTYDVVAVGDARSALVSMHNTRFDGLVLDINLGGKETGADILRIARSLDGYTSVFAIALTAYALPGDRERLLEKGFSEYISKPFTRSSLMESLERGVGVAA